MTKINKLFVALLAGGAIFGMVFALAATLNVSSNDLASGTQLVAACDVSGNGNVSYATSFSASPAPGYYVTAVSVTDLDSNCNTQTAYVTLTDGSSTLASGSGTVSGGSAAISGLSASAAAVSNVYVLITP
jgi:X-X-X-Leu-X-X-Gly heptad repeat protein